MEAQRQATGDIEMYYQPDLLLSEFHKRQRELVAEADRYRLLAAVRRARRALRPTQRGRPDGTLITCAPRAAAPAR
jgi:hypothetical protein